MLNSGWVNHGWQESCKATIGAPLYFGSSPDLGLVVMARASSNFMIVFEIRNMPTIRALSLIACASVLSGPPLNAEPVSVRYTEGATHGYLKMQTTDGKTVAWGELTQAARARQITSHVVFRYLDGSVYQETTVFSQQGTFRLIRDHLIQKGPSFKQPMDTTIEVETGQVTVRYSDKDGEEKVHTEHFDLPADLANGLLFTLLKDLPPNAQKTTLSMVASTPKPRLVKLAISTEGTEAFSIGTIPGKATHHIVKVELGGIVGAVAHVTGKQPPDVHVWIAAGSVPGFIKFEGPLEENGPIMQIVLAQPAVFKASTPSGLTSH